jgi:hypothetical protein
MLEPMFSCEIRSALVGKLSDSSPKDTYAVDAPGLVDEIYLWRQFFCMELRNFKPSNANAENHQRSGGAPAATEPTYASNVHTQTASGRQTSNTTATDTS